MKNSRYVLREERGWFCIQEQPWDEDFGAYLAGGVDIGRFRDREDARQFMIGYMERQKEAASAEA